MLWSQTLIPTLRETPEAAEIPSHVLMLRAGLISQVTAGAYSYLPLGLRCRQKAAGIIRRRLAAAGAVELAMPRLSPVSLWQQAGRAETLAEELFQFSARRHGRNVRLALAPAHEEIVTKLVARLVSSYRQMPLLLSRVGTVFRNQPRPGPGVLRTSEFLAADAYSFDATPETLEKSYHKFYAAFRGIFEHCSLPHLAVEAESQLDEGSPGHVFVVPAENGEAPILHCFDCGYAATRERAEIGPLDATPPAGPFAELTRVHTPGCTTVEQVTGLLGCRPEHLIKTLIYLADGRPIAVLVRGDHEANEAKIRRVAGARSIELAPPGVIRQVTGAPVGFAGPVGMKEKIPMFADRDVQHMADAVAGANQADAHFTGVNVARDFQPDAFADLRCAAHGDSCPRCSSKLTARRAFEIGYLTKPGSWFSEKLGAKFVDDREAVHPILMGAYRINVDRLLAAAIESGHDRSGIVWPVALAPYEVLLMPLAAGDGPTMTVAEALHDELSAAGVDVLLDDRHARPGVKFNDADLIGVPLRVVVGSRGLKQGKLEVKWRWDEKPETIDLDGVAEVLAELICDERRHGTRYRGWHVHFSAEDVAT